MPTVQVDRDQLFKLLGREYSKFKSVEVALSLGYSVYHSHVLCTDEYRCCIDLYFNQYIRRNN